MSDLCIICYKNQRVGECLCAWCELGVYIKNDVLFIYS